MSVVDKGRKARVGHLERVLPKKLRPPPGAPRGLLGESPRQELSWRVPALASGSCQVPPRTAWWKISTAKQALIMKMQVFQHFSDIANADVWPFRS